MSTRTERLVAMTAALASATAMVASLLTFQAVRALSATQLPTHCTGFLAVPLQGQTVLVPADLCDPANRAAMQGPQQRQEQRQPSYSI